jgi:hypothetical protein
MKKKKNNKKHPFGYLALLTQVADNFILFFLCLFFNLNDAVLGEPHRWQMQFLIQNTMFVDWFIYSLPWGRVGELDKASICDRGLIIKILKIYGLLWFLSVFLFFFVYSSWTA